LLHDPLSLGLLALALLSAGVLAGLIAGLLGVGGGIVIVPVLYHLFGLIGLGEDVRMHVAVGTSLASIILTSTSSIRAHLQRDAVDKDLLRSWAPAIVAGVIAGTVLAGAARGQVLTALFATMAMLVAVNMTFMPANLRVSDHLPSGVVKHTLGMLIGGISAMMGIGGGTLTVPTLVLCDYPIRRAVGTASAIGFIIAIPGTLGFMAGGWGTEGLPAFSLGYVNFLGLALIAPTSMAMAPVGAKLAHTIDPRRLKQAFAVFLMLTSARMFHGLLF